MILGSGDLRRIAHEDATLRAIIEAIKDAVTAKVTPGRAPWYRMVSEDLLVQGDAFYENVADFPVIDASTISILLTEAGEAPLPPDAAYQQIIDGQPFASFTTDELFRLRRLSNRGYYGQGLVEEYYVSGRLPDIHKSAAEILTLAGSHPRKSNRLDESKNEP